MAFQYHLAACIAYTIKLLFLCLDETSHNQENVQDLINITIYQVPERKTGQQLRPGHPGEPRVDPHSWGSRVPL